MIKEQLHKESKDKALEFGVIHTDHMLVADYEDGSWKDYEIVPFSTIELSPFSQIFHYGQSIFEGLKAFKNNKNKIRTFRLFDHYKRFSNSALRLCMPEVPERFFVDGITKLIKKDQNWVPKLSTGSSLYIRPILFATDPILRVTPSRSYKFIVVLSPSGAYFNKPVNILVEDFYMRATPGGTGEAKVGGNYANTLLPAKLAAEKGYDQVLWTDPADGHNTIQEIGAMNVFFVIDDTVITPKLDGAILDGITRKSIITILKDKEINIEERKITINEIIDAYSTGKLKEAFGSGTAAVVSDIASMTYHDKKMTLNPENYLISPMLSKTIYDVRNGDNDVYSKWMIEI